MAESANAATVSTIRVITWPTLWLHWPVYLALVRTERQFNNKVKFQLESLNAEILTDDLIRNEFYSRAEKGDAVLALCEPGPERTLIIDRAMDGGGTLRRDPVMIRRLPVVWRQPHWLLWRGNSRTPPVGHKVWAYPAKTTSGDFVRTIFQSLPLLRSNQAYFHALAQEMDEQLQRVETLAPESDVVASFTPWHEFLNDSSKEGGNHEIRGWTLPGPSRDVTSLLVPDITAEWTRKGGVSVIEAVGRHLKNVLNELSDTHGDNDLMYQFLTDNVPNVKLFLGQNESAAGVDYLGIDFLRSVLCIYVRHGCYFPYRSVDSAISSEVQKRIRDRLDGLKELALTGIQTDLNEFLGSSSEWHTLSFDERAQAWHTATPIDLHGRHYLWERLTHFTQDEIQNGIENTIRTISIRTSHSPTRISLINLGPKLPLECSILSGNDHQHRLAQCLDNYSPVPFLVDPNHATINAYDCLACVVSGVPRSLLRPAALRLANALNTPIGYYWAKDNITLFDVPCPVSVEDVRGVIDVFIDERRNLPTNLEKPACEVVLFNGFNGRKASNGGPILFGLFWRGSTEAGRGSGSAQMRLRYWADKQRSLGHHFEWLGFWFRDRKDLEIQTDRPSPSSNHEFIEATAVSEPARKYFVDNGFQFAYIVVFRVRHEDTNGEP